MAGRGFLSVGLAVGYTVFFLCGCTGKKSEPENGTAKDKEPGMVEYMTGAAQAKTYLKTRSKIEDINKTMKEQYQEAQQ